MTGIIKLVLVAALALFGVISAFTMVMQIDTQEVGVITRFGKHVRTVDPGLRMKAPFFIEKLHRVPLERQMKLEFGFRTDEGKKDEERFSRVLAESLMLTGDLNVVNVEFSVQMRVADPYAYLFNVRDNEVALRALAEATMREIVGDRTVTEVLTVGRQEIEVGVRKQLNEMVQMYAMGLAIDQVVLQDVSPPDPVRPAWDEVNQAQQDRDRVINEAWTEYNRVIPRTLGQAEAQILHANAYGVERVNRARGEANRFLSIYEEYRKAPAVTRTRLYNEAMAGVFSSVNELYVLNEGSSGLHSVLPLPAPGSTPARAAATATTPGGN